MTTLHIEHAITDYPTWRGAFDRFAQLRADAGVRSHTVRRPVDDERYIVVDLDFLDESAARSFLGFLEANVWANAENAPGLVGEPRARILEDS